MTPAEGNLESSSPVERARERFRADAIAGLGRAPKRLSPKYFYDAAGSQLFDSICELPEYYLTRTETSIMEARAREIVASWGPRVRVVEPGAGSGTKTRLVLEALGAERCVEYVPVDISREHLADAAARLRTEIPWLRVVPVAGDFTTGLPARHADDDVRTVVYFPGSTLGNFDPAEAERLLGHFAAAAGAGGAVVLGIDLKKTPEVLHAAYNDSEGVTAAFNKNVLARMNRELGADIDLETFAHYAFYEPLHGRIEMHLVSLVPQEIQVSGESFSFGEGESIRTECSYKYDLPSVTRLAARAGLAVERQWLDEQRRFAVLELRPSTPSAG